MGCKAISWNICIKGQTVGAIRESPLLPCQDWFEGLSETGGQGDKVTGGISRAPCLPVSLSAYLNPSFQNWQTTTSRIAPTPMVGYLPEITLGDFSKRLYQSAPLPPKFGGFWTQSPPELGSQSDLGGSRRGGTGVDLGGLNSWYLLCQKSP
jgi:hypothetical protein